MHHYDLATRRSITSCLFYLVFLCFCCCCCYYCYNRMSFSLSYIYCSYTFARHYKSFFLIIYIPSCTSVHIAFKAKIEKRRKKKIAFEDEHTHVCGHRKVKGNAIKGPKRFTDGSTCMEVFYIHL